MNTGTKGIDLKCLSLVEVKALRTAATKRIQSIRQQKRTKMEVYIPAEITDDLEASVEWAFAHNLIKKKTRWSFCKMAVVNTISTIMEQVRIERAQKVEQITILPDTVMIPASEELKTSQAPPELRSPTSQG